MIIKFNFKINDISYKVFFHLAPFYLPPRVYIGEDREIGQASFNIKDNIIDWQSAKFEPTFIVTEELKQKCDKFLKFKAFW